MVVKRIRRPLVSACLIVRDEERVLDRCLRSLAAAVDEIVIADTGSTDRSVEIARAHGARVRRFTACNDERGRMVDFAAARNAALAMALGRWLLAIDADEVLVEGAARLRRHARRDRLAGVGVLMREGDVTWITGRLFRNRRTHRYFGRVHEWLELDGEIEYDRSIVIEHHPDKRGKESTFDRNRRLLEEELAAHPNSGRALFHLANGYYTEDRLRAALRHYRRFLAVDGTLHVQRVTAARLAAECEIRLGRLEAGIAAALDALAIDPRYAEVHCLLGDAYRLRGDHDFAAHWYRQALACGGPPADAALFVVRNRYDAYPRARLAECARSLAKSPIRRR